ncbi:hypothetical protein [Aeromicrobium sp. Leaf350]|uniref:hypothetical protein n=1 Tax=Aeromicrobium sp. Leaf350 TaxID=2876565 RepID=UPI001E4D0909|nr:hypothetical protein [Aeromicrobium sp. Leaf350]
MLEQFFRASFVVATALQVVVVAVLCVQVARAVRSRSSDVSTVITTGDTVTGVLMFAGPAVLVSTVLHGWLAVDGTDVLTYASAFGIVSAAVIEWGRAHDRPAARLVILLPLAMGVVAGAVTA